MRVRRLESPQEFLDLTWDYRAARTVHTNVIGSIAQGVADGSRTYRGHTWWAMEDHGMVVGAAMHTEPYRMVLGPMDTRTATVLATHVAALDTTLWGMSGQLEPTGAFMRAYAQATGRSTQEFPVALRETVFALSGDPIPPRVSGTARPAGHDDIPWLAKAFSDFVAESGIFAKVPDEQRWEENLAHYTVLLWEDEGRVVAMASHATPVKAPGALIGRIGSVWVVPDSRSHGYGTAVTMAMAEHLRGHGCTEVMLYANSDYTQSNRRYRALGFDVVGTVVELGTPPEGLHA